MRIYVENLIKRLSDTKADQQERLAAVSALATVISQYANVPTVVGAARGALMTAQSDKDALVQAAAKAVLQPKPSDSAEVTPTNPKNAPKK